MNLNALILIVAISIVFCANSRADAAADFAEACRERAASGEGISVVGDDGWLFLRAELAHLGKGEFWGDAAQVVSTASSKDRRNPLPAITNYFHSLGREEIELLLVPVPPKAVVYPEPAVGIDLPPAPSRLDGVHENFYQILSSNGIQVIDLGPEYTASRSATNEFYCRTDTHWSGFGCVRAAQRMAERIKTMDWYESVPKHDFVAEWRTRTIDGDLRRAVPGEAAPAKETISIRFVGRKSGDELQPVDPDPLSPVLVMADSHGLVFHAGGDMHGIGAGLADQLSYELGFPVALIAMRGSGATPPRESLFRKARKNPEFLNTKKVVVWCFTAREFTETDGWMEVPVKR